MSPTGWAGLAEAAERTASKMNEQGIANTLNALGKLQAAAAAVCRRGGRAWRRRWTGRRASEMNPQGVGTTLNALCKAQGGGGGRRRCRRRGGLAWRRRRRGRRIR